MLVARGGGQGGGRMLPGVSGSLSTAGFSSATDGGASGNVGGDGADENLNSNTYNIGAGGGGWLAEPLVALLVRPAEGLLVALVAQLSQVVIH